MILSRGLPRRTSEGTAPRSCPQAEGTRRRRGGIGERPQELGGRERWDFRKGGQDAAGGLRCGRPLGGANVGGRSGTSLSWPAVRSCFCLPNTICRIRIRAVCPSVVIMLSCLPVCGLCAGIVVCPSACFVRAQLCWSARKP